MRWDAIEILQRVSLSKKWWFHQQNKFMFSKFNNAKNYKQQKSTQVKVQTKIVSDQSVQDKEDLWSDYSTPKCPLIRLKCTWKIVCAWSCLWSDLARRKGPLIRPKSDHCPDFRVTMAQIILQKIVRLKRPSIRLSPDRLSLDLIILLCARTKLYLYYHQNLESLRNWKICNLSIINYTTINHKL